MHVLWLVLHVARGVASLAHAVQTFSNNVFLRNLGLLICRTFSHLRVPKPAGHFNIDGLVDGWMDEWMG